MAVAALLLSRFELWIYAVLGILAVLYIRALWLANARWQATPFGLEREQALQKQNRALFMLILVLALGGSVFLVNRLVVPTAAIVQTEKPTEPPPTLAPTSTPIQGDQPLVVDSSGCQNPQVTLTRPASGETITGAYEVVGTADIPNFAFYKLEISGRLTSGAWVPLYVGNTPVKAGTLGRFDSTAYGQGEYAFRLMVMDGSGNSVPPCVVTITIANAVPTLMPTAAP